jgi:hypothetical protein
MARAFPVLGQRHVCPTPSINRVFVGCPSSCLPLNLGTHGLTIRRVCHTCLCTQFELFLVLPLVC